MTLTRDGVASIARPDLRDPKLGQRRRSFAELLADRDGRLHELHFAEQVPAIVEALVRTFRGGGKVLWCGNGGCAADAQHLAAEFSGRFLRERKVCRRRR